MGTTNGTDKQRAKIKEISIVEGQGVVIESIRFEQTISVRSDECLTVNRDTGEVYTEKLDE